ncbi:MAG: ABC transporter permease [Candidatus Margulisbacteria bacterium]|nr:ABC transporter permease [Candidatus Margulisiibacteriota bacterium]MBU1616437.1 ABC transporter permease [Candidatus Margulisiibacteriota bacterium]MBU1866883.1 ABC transporter permease [Candidatus Margulisiibacteriota bacterium]
MINLVEPLKLASQSLLANKLRTILTTMGVVIGVAAVITLVSMGEGAKSYVLNQISGWGVGSNSITIQPGEGSGTSIPELTLTYEDMIAIRDKVKKIQYVMPELVGRGRIKYGKKEYTPGYTLGVSQDYPLAYKQKAVEGRFFSLAEDNGRKRVVVIGKTVVRNLFGNFSPIGEKIKINGIGYLVIGVLEEKGAMLSYDMDDMVLIPSSLAELTLGVKKIWEMMVTTYDDKDVPEVMSEIEKLLFARHRKIDFHMHTQAGLIDITNNILNALTGIVSAIAAISLLVGGIGIMNIMLVAVTERTREIGIRKAIGAKRRDIFLQFVMESILITISGAVLGISIGTLASWGIMSALKLEAVIAYNAAAIACFVALIVGLFFGVYPAMRAARLDPVDALRFEV